MTHTSSFSTMAQNQLTNHQKEILLAYIQEHPGLATDEFAGLQSQTLWERISMKLNAVPFGSVKTWFRWRKTWFDLYKNIKIKTRALRCHDAGTGPPVPNLTPWEKRVARVINSPEFDTLPNCALTRLMIQFSNREFDSDSDLDEPPVTRASSSQPLVEQNELPRKAKESNVKHTQKNSEHLLCMIQKEYSRKERFQEEKIKYMHAKMEYMKELLALKKQKAGISLNDTTL